jgi:hypothetical protein
MYPGSGYLIENISTPACLTVYRDVYESYSGAPQAVCRDVEEALQALPFLCFTGKMSHSSLDLEALGQLIYGAQVTTIGYRVQGKSPQLQSQSLC